ncbi:hypothetical protein CONLIGDRAFT_110971 [Coniochaeta ligniaria NRRL 30616]|uniref:Secreted protein n=1 Tax=Coniochaeta ligniaria NRRL 30616 TaxID=1408157 RepID=A0A1J7J1U6_9PEZI|nr:hypothetical protein CONLIGDRAFT_110971 [Coniochaeta ligniaria NRRL 30616]
MQLACALACISVAAYSVRLAGTFVSASFIRQERFRLRPVFALAVLTGSDGGPNIHEGDGNTSQLAAPRQSRLLHQRLAPVLCFTVPLPTRSSSAPSLPTDLQQTLGKYSGTMIGISGA